MFKNYLTVALRAMAKNKLYASINILGLAVGLSVYLFATILADYEKNHDVNFTHHQRIYTIGSMLSENASIGVRELDNTYSSMAPFIAAGMSEEVEHVARSINRQYMVSVTDKHFHEGIKFVDKAFLNIFDFDYINGDATALDDPNGLLITEEMANKWFGTTDVVGQSIRFNHEHDFFISAVIKDLPRNTHFYGLITGTGVGAVGSLVALNRIAEWDLEGNWNNLNTGDHTYVMTYESQDIASLEQKVNAIFDRHVDPEMKEQFMRSLTVRPLKNTSTAIWDMIGMPVIESVQLLGLLVLVIAIVNYTNLATAQSMGRAREVGLRKTMGASRPQLITQFLLESLTTAAFAMVIAVAMIEAIVPAFNEVTQKVVELQYLTLLPWLMVTTLAVGLIAGAYPAILITKTAPITALKDGHNKGSKGNFFRSLMIGVQFTLSIFMLAVVMIVFFQNEKVKQSSNIYPKDEVLVLQRAGIESIKQRHDVLKSELLKVNGVSQVSYTMQVPFDQSNSTRNVSKVKGDEENKVSFHLNYVDHDYLATFDIPLIAGRQFDKNITSDQVIASEQEGEGERRQANVLVNELFISQLGLGSPQQAVGQSVWGPTGEDGEAFEYKIIGVIEDQNLQGLHNSVKPWLFMIDASGHNKVAVRIQKGAHANIVSDIENAWQRVIPDYPIEHVFLDDVFNEIYTVYKALNGVLAGFAALALFLALIGLFGMAAFMARGKTREIGIRKVLGASLIQIIRLISWQFSKPVLWAIVVALPLAYIASSTYLQFFAERIDIQVPIILLSGIIAVALAWVIIAFHALRVARANPIHALRYE